MGDAYMRRDRKVRAISFCWIFLTVDFRCRWLYYIPDSQILEGWAGLNAQFDCLNCCNLSETKVSWDTVKFKWRNDPRSHAWHHEVRIKHRHPIPPECDVKVLLTFLCRFLLWVVIEYLGLKCTFNKIKTLTRIFLICFLFSAIWNVREQLSKFSGLFHWITNIRSYVCDGSAREPPIMQIWRCQPSPRPSPTARTLPSEYQAFLRVGRRIMFTPYFGC